MNVDEAITTRHSVRAFLPTPVPDTDIEHILNVASHSPSGNNTQPWRVYVVTGGARERVCSAVLEARENAPRPEREYRSNPAPLPEPLKARSRQNGIALYTLLGVEKGDQAAHHAQQRRNYRFFDAPVGLFFFIDRRLERGNWLDYGMFVQSVMLAARGRGLQTCAQGAWANFHPVVRACVGASDDELLICGMALGYADESAPVNALEVPREPSSVFARWCT
ncbi:MAG: nitroreductase [Gammaproteobacteria bacterium]